LRYVSHFGPFIFASTGYAHHASFLCAAAMIKFPARHAGAAGRGKWDRPAAPFAPLLEPGSKDCLPDPRWLLKVVHVDLSGVQMLMTEKVPKCEDVGALVLQVNRY
jgi:hypothetical protein